MLEGLTSAMQGYLQGAPLLAYVAAFVGGIAASFTPCVYPLIPITVGYIGSQSVGSKKAAFSLSFFYVLGIAITYAALGVFSALTGRLFGQAVSNPWVFFVAGNICILLGLSLLEVFTLPLPSFLTSHKGQVRGHGFIPALLTGMFFGLVMGPCTAPILGFLLLFVATKQNLLFGASLMFVFAFGMGLLLMAIGTFAGVMASLPKAGEWMVKVKKVFGFFMLAVGEYFIVNMGKALV